MELLPIDDLIVPESRQRREFDEKRIQELAQSIKSKGLLHPLVVRNDGRTLVAGERRLRALRTLQEAGETYSCNARSVPSELVPVVRLTDLSDILVREAELEENVLRKDLTWQELVAARAELHKLRTEQNPGQTKRDTQEEITGKRPAGGAGIVDDALLIAPHLDDPAIAAAPDKKTALRLVKKKVVREFLSHLDPETEKSVKHTIFQGDFRIKLLDLPDETFDCILTDPPYGVEVQEIDPSQVKIAHEYDDSYDDWLALMAELAKEAYRLAKPRAHAYVFCSLQRFDELKRVFEEKEWRVFRTPLIWHKPNAGVVPWAGHGPRCCTEGILYANKGWRPTIKAGSDLLEYSQVHDPLHAAKKPQAIYEELLSRCCYPGDKVLDPFCGAGTIFEAANSLSLKATGVELNKDHFNLSMSRM